MQFSPLGCPEIFSSWHRISYTVPRGSVQATPLNKAEMGNNSNLWSFCHNISETVQDITHVIIKY